MRLLAHRREVLLELGRNFWLVREQYRVQVGPRDGYIDLLVCHRALQALVAESTAHLPDTRVLEAKLAEFAALEAEHDTAAGA